LLDVGGHAQDVGLPVLGQGVEGAAGQALGVPLGAVRAHAAQLDGVAVLVAEPGAADLQLSVGGDGGAGRERGDGPGRRPGGTVGAGGGGGGRGGGCGGVGEEQGTAEGRQDGGRTGVGTCRSHGGSPFARGGGGGDELGNFPNGMEPERSP